jgi:hypothetical protein
MFRGLTIRSLLLVSVIARGAGQAPRDAVPVEGAPAEVAPRGDESKTYTVPAGTKILLSLKNEISTRVAMPGDPVYLVSDFPVVEDGAVVLPAGMYVKGVIDSVQRPRKVNGHAQIQLHVVSMTLPNGAEIRLPLTVDRVPSSTGATVKNAEGTVEQSGSGGKGTERIATNTVEGAGLGSMVGYGAGNVGLGAGIGAGAGATAEILTTLLTRGNDIEIPQGTTLDMVMSRPLVLQQRQLAGMPAYTGMSEPASEPKVNK